jgi:hypothetical protein
MIIGNKGNGSLGDILWMTSICRYVENVKLLLHNDEQSKWVGKIFNNLCEVDYVDEPPDRPDNIIDTNKEPYLSSHRSRKILLSIGIENTVSVPLIKLTFDEIDWARNFLKDYSNPIVVINDNSGTWDKNNIRSLYVRPPINVMQNIIDKLINDKYTPLQFGRIEDDKFTKLSKAVPIRGLSLRETAACYYIINKYIGGDTGDYHLMLSVGGNANVLIPNESINLGYIYNDLLYKPENFENSVNRVKYINYNLYL